MNIRLLLAISLLGLSATFAANLTPEQRIDTLIEAGLEKHGVTANAPIDDATFLRRVYLNIAGRIPTIEEAEAFHINEYPKKRERLVETLLQSEAYVSNFYHFWADLLRINGEIRGAPRDAYELWVKDALRDNKPYDQMVRELVTATGLVWENGAIGYYHRDRGMPLDNMSNTVRIFLGTRLECAQCHNHPFDQWTQMDYFKMAAFSYGMSARNYNSDNRKLVSQHLSTKAEAAYQETIEEKFAIQDFPFVKNEKAMSAFLVARKKGRESWIEQNGYTEEKFRKIVAVGQAASEEIMEQQEAMRRVVQELYDPLQYISAEESAKNPSLPHDYQYTDAKPNDTVAPAAMFGGEVDLENADSRIDAYAAWMTSKENPTFTKVIVNRLWKEVFGLGIVEPVDELTELTQPSNPELLAYLEALMRDFDYDIKRFLQVLYNTQAYQRTADFSEIVMGAPYHFQGPILRRMSAEQIWDSVVALALPEADYYRPRVKNQLSSIEKNRLIYTSLEERTPEEFIAMVEELAPALQQRYVDEANYRDLIVQARDADDMERYKELRLEMREAAREVDKKISEVGYIHLREKVDAGALLVSLGMNEVAAGMMADMGDDAEITPVMTSLPKVQFPEMPEGLNKTEKRDWAASQKQDVNVYRSLISGMARAAELESPAKRGHFLRDFGQSDREVIDNAADNASVPQALNLLNGPMVEALTNKFAVFGSRIHEAGTPEAKTRMIFQAMLTRQPTATELALVKNEVEVNGEAAYEGIVWALLNTQQFLFVR